jgi:hypothetical protein
MITDIIQMKALRLTKNSKRMNKRKDFVKKRTQRKRNLKMTFSTIRKFSEALPR